jgi:hypothetical protein
MGSPPDCRSMIRRTHNPHPSTGKMNDRTDVAGSPQRAWPRAARSTAAVIGTAVLVLVAAACSGSPSSTAGSSHTEGSLRSPSAVAFSACMRSHGITNFPDPNPGGRPLEVDAQQLGVSDGLYQAAEQGCQDLLPTGGSLQQRLHQCLLYGDCPQTLMQPLMTIERNYAECMRSHGVPNWPDPSISAKGGRPVFDLTGTGIDTQFTDSPQFRSNDRECRLQTDGSVPSLPYTS